MADPPPNTSLTLSIPQPSTSPKSEAGARSSGHFGSQRVKLSVCICSDSAPTQCGLANSANTSCTVIRPYTRQVPGLNLDTDDPMLIAHVCCDRTLVVFALCRHPFGRGIYPWTLHYRSLHRAGLVSTELRSHADTLRTPKEPPPA